MNDNVEPPNPLAKLEQKIDALTTTVERMDERLGRIDERLGRVDERLERVDERLGRVEKDLSETKELASDTKSFSRDVYDKLISLEAKMENSFKDAKKHQDDHFHDVHSAIRRWGERVVELEKPQQRRATKRRR